MIALLLVACMPQTPETTIEDTGTAPAVTDTATETDTGTTSTDTVDTGYQAETGDTSTAPTDTAVTDTQDTQDTQDTEAPEDTAPTDTAPPPFECTSEWGNVTFSDGETEQSKSYTGSSSYLAAYPLQGSGDLCSMSSDRPWLTCWVSTQGDCDSSAVIELPAEDAMSGDTLHFCLSIDWDPGSDRGVCTLDTSKQSLTWQVIAS